MKWVVGRVNLKEGEGERVEIIEVFADVYQYSASTLIVVSGYNAQ